MSAKHTEGDVYNEKKRQLVNNYFKMFPSGRYLVIIQSEGPHSSGPHPTPQSPLLSPILAPPPPFFELSPVGLALLSPVLIGSLTNPVVPLNIQCVKLDRDCLLQEGREVAIFLGWMGRVWAEEHWKFLNKRRREKM